MRYAFKMAEKTVVVSHQDVKPIQILKWKIRQGFSLSIGSLVLIYDFEKVEKKEQRKLKSPQAGTVRKLIAKEGAIILPGEPLFELQPCIHSTVMKDMCAECGADLRKDDLNSIASVPMIHSVPELKVSQELAEKLGKADGERLLKDKKLVLLVDLDQTLIHTTNDIIPPNLKDVYHFQLYGPQSQWYHTRLRPGTIQFLTNIASYFELHICTFGARNYAHKITGILDADGKFFSNRVLSRDECFNPTSKTANLTALFPCGDHMVCIIDDREDVWSNALNLIHVKPYHFFKHTGDINAPPGLEKHENDEKDGVDLTALENNSNNQFEERKDEVAEDSKIEVVDEIEVVEENKNEAVKEYEVVEKDKLVTSTEGMKISADNGTPSTANEENTLNGINKATTENGNEESKDDKEKSTLQKSTINDKDKVNMENVNEQKNGKSDLVNEIEDQVPEKSAQENLIAFDEIQEVKFESSSNKIDCDDPDDYLLYLEDILKRIHFAFYEEYVKTKSEVVPDLKAIIPSVKKQILRGCSLIFSGLVPTHIRLKNSKAYQVARSLGAKVTEEFCDSTTHLVAVRPGTAKVNTGKRKKNLKIVTPDWLWTCAERWEHVNELIFPLNSKGSKSRHPPPHCSSPEHATNYDVRNSPASRQRSPSGRFMDTINPLMSFSSADIEDMDKEVEEILDDDSESEDDVKQSNTDVPFEKEGSSSSSDDSLSGDTPRGHKRNHSELDNDDPEGTTKDTDDFPAKFRRGDELDSDLDIGQNSNSDGSIDAPDEMDDGDWNMMGAALEREFLSNS